jgi:uncharacterized protein (TIGR02001 family)
MKKLLLSTATALVLSTGLASAADLKMVGKAPPAPAPAPSMWDIAFGGALTTDYNFRGISQSDRGPSVFGYFEPRFKLAPFELYAGIAGASVKLATDPAAEIDFYGGVRWTWDKLAVDVGAIYYYYPKEREIDGIIITAPPAFNTTLTDTDFWEVYAKLTYNWNDAFSTGVQAWYSPNWLNTGADGTFLVGNAKYVLPWKIPFMSDGIGMYLSGEFGHYWFGTTDLAVSTTGVAVFVDNTGTTGWDLPDYNYWSAGLGFTYKAFTLDFRYYDTDLSQAECNALTADPGAAVIAPTIINNFTTVGASKWCKEAFVARLSWDLTLDSLK